MGDAGVTIIFVIQMPRPSVFITGATGLVGSHLARLLLLQGFDRITALRRADSPIDLIGPEAERIHWIEGDVLDVMALHEGMHGAEWVFHCAGLISYDPADTAKLIRVNGEGTANVVNVALDTGVRQLMHISSISVLARSGRDQICSEETPWQETAYTSNYGLSKHLAEQEIRRGIAEGLHASVIIPSIILGAGDWKSGSATIFHQIGKGMPAYPLGKNGYVDVRDVCDLALRVMEGGEPRRLLVSGHSVSYRDLFSAIAARIGKRPPRIPVGPVLSEVLWRLFLPVKWVTGRLPVINREMNRAAQCAPEYDNRVSLTIPGFQYTPLGRTLDDIAEVYLLAKEKKFAPGRLHFQGDQDV